MGLFGGKKSQTQPQQASSGRTVNPWDQGRRENLARLANQQKTVARQHKAAASRGDIGYAYQLKCQLEGLQRQADQIERELD